MPRTPEQRATRRAGDRKRYNTDPESRAKQRERQNRWSRNKYATDPEYRAKNKAKCLEDQFLKRSWGVGSL